MGKKLFIVVNVDWFFLSHRLPIALAAKEKGYNVTIVTADTGKRHIITQHGLNFIEIPFSRSGTNILQELKLIGLLKKLYLQHKPDVIHHVTLKPSIYGSIAAKRAGIKGVINAVSGLGYNFTSNRKGVKQFILNMLLKKAFAKNKLQFIFQNRDDVAMFENNGFIKDPNNIHLIKGSGVDLNTFHFFDEPGGDKIKILLPARMLYDKGVIEFITAAKTLKDAFGETVCFNLAGDVDMENPAVVTVAELNRLIDSPYINWIGFQTSMVDVLSEHHIVVLPSYREGLPKSLIEACAIGRPIITTDAPGCRECVIEGYNGFLVPVKDSVLLAERIVKLVNNRELRKEMGKNSRQYAEENFSIATVIHKTLELYNKLSNE